MTGLGIHVRVYTHKDCMHVGVLRAYIPGYFKRIVLPTGRKYVSETKGRV